MVPKIIHYCWFGRGEMPALVKKCIKSWKKYCPDWEIVCWNEDCFDVESALFTKQAYDAKKYAFVADYVRLKALYEIGGVYMDTDQELRKPLDNFLHHKVFLGFMDSSEVSAGLVGAEKGHPFIRSLQAYYVDRSFLNEDGTINMIPNTRNMTELLVNDGLVINDTYQEIGDVAVYPETYFCPTYSISADHCITDDTVSIHHWMGSWHSEAGRKNMKRVKRHSTRIYRAWEKAKILPQIITRRVLGDDTVEKWKKKLGK